MNVFHFGDPERPLYGAHHEPAPSNDLRRGAVLCAPVGQEYLRSHWCMRRLADRLANAGVHALRFDYAGQGDSWGDDRDVSVQRWVSDVSDAIEELRDASGVSRISLVGLRFGSALAALAASQIQGIDKLVLWDPIPEGASYLQGLRVLHDAKLSRWKFARSDAIPNGVEELVGRVWPSELMSGIESFNMAGVTPAVGRAYVLCSESRPEYESIGEQWSGISVFKQIIETAGDWDDLDEMDEALLASPIEAAIADILTEKTS